MKLFTGGVMGDLPAGSLETASFAGTEEGFSANDAMLLPPGHDAWTVSDELTAAADDD